jgi:hypothetical protein
MSSRQFKSFSKAPGRSATRLARHLEKNLLAYAAAASAGLISLSLPAEAEVIYTPCNTSMTLPIFGAIPAPTPLDLNNDGTADFSFGMFSNARGSFGSTTYIKFFLNIVPLRAGNGVVQGQQAQAAAAVPNGKKIGPGQQFAAGARYMSLFSFFGSTVRNSGSWSKVEFAYIGLKFMIDGQLHYGWARVKFPDPGDTHYPSIYGYAYESTPNQPILTGQTDDRAVEATAEDSASESAPASLGMLAGGVATRRPRLPENPGMNTH